MITDNKINKPFVGMYYLDGTEDGVKLGLTKKPSSIRIFLTKLMLGWVWHDIGK